MIDRDRMVLFSATLLFASVLSGCATRQLESEGEPVIDAQATATRLVASTLPTNPKKLLTFNWNLQEGRTRLQGQGVVRYEAPDRLRLDLFGPRGTTYLSAALVEGHFRLPPNARDVVILPSPSLLWGALGIFQPPAATQLLSVTTDGGITSVRYGAADQEVFDFRLTESVADARLSSIERAGSDGVVESLELKYDETGALVSAHYRNWADFRDLEIQVEKIDDATPFPDEIWLPGGGD